jgi:hypothetical protein
VKCESTKGTARRRIACLARARKLTLTP